MTTSSAVAAAAAPTPDARFELVPLDRLVESPSNHRRRSWGDLNDLAASIRAKGVLEPILVRPVKGIGSNLFEIVFGHRRFRSAKVAGLKAIPAMVREMSDLDVVEAQVIENLQRQDVHALEEAEGYEQLLASKERQYTVDEIAAKVGKSKAYIYARMKLLALCKEAREAFYADKLTASVALLVARIPDAARQKEALLALKPDPWEKAPKSFREAAEIIHHGFMLRLADAPFDRADATLVPSAGACTACPHRSGAQPELFEDVDAKRGDVCTNTPCFEAKKKTWAERRKNDAEASGQKVLAGEEAKKLFQYGSLRAGAGYVELSEKCWEDPKNRTYKHLLGKKAPVVLVENPGGDLVELVEKKAVRDLLKEAGHRFASEAARPSATDTDSRQREKKRHDLKRLTVRKAITAIVAAAQAKAFDDAAIRLLADAILDLAWHDTATDIVQRRGIERGKGERPDDALEHLVTKMTPSELRGLIVEALVTRGAYFSYQMGYTDRLRAAAKFYGVDIEKCNAEAKAEIKAKADAKKSGKRADAPAKHETWSLTPNARTVPEWVRDLTGLTTVAALEKKFGQGAKFTKGSPTPPAAARKTSAPGELTWRPGRGNGIEVADATGGKYEIADNAGMCDVAWFGDGKDRKFLGHGLTRTAARAAAKKHHLENAADAILANAGAGELTKKELKGPAVTRKKGRRG